jgi:hypothetical protein
MLNVAWDYGILRKRNIDANRFMDLYFGRSSGWRGLLIGQQGTLEIATDFDKDDPVARHPTWEYGQEISLLQQYVETVPTDRDHRVVVIRPPAANTGLGRQFYRLLTEMQEDHPECILHVHGMYSYRMMFGPWYRSVDFEPRLLAKNGKVTLPTGKEVRFEATFEEAHWVTLLGFRPSDLRVPRNRCIFNIKSAQWASEHFKDAVKIRTKGFINVDPDDPFKRVPTSKSIMVRRIRPKDSDKLLCNTCSLQTACKYYREGAVCIVPDSEPQELAKFFKSRDSDTIIDGLGTLLATQANRLDKALESEEVDEKLHPETRKIIESLFDRGVKLAKLLDPKLAAAGAPKFNFNQTTITSGTPQALMKAITESFVAQGIPRNQITPEMIMSVFKDPDEMKARAIETAAVEKSA